MQAKTAAMVLADKPPKAAGKKVKALPRAMSKPQAKLWGLVKLAWPVIAHSEFKGAVPGRRFTLDIAFPESKNCVEVDGWEFHGKHKAGFHRDREKEKLLMLEGWKLIRFSAKEINSDTMSCLKTIEKIIGIPSKISLV